MTPKNLRVFLNVPFDRDYEPLFVATIAALAAHRLEPHCVLELPDRGEGRLRRIFKLMQSCGASVHDLSRVEVRDGAQPRFNMPFELGLAYALSRTERHNFVVMETERFRLQRSLSDLNGHDPQIHHGKAEGVFAAIESSFATRVRPRRERVREVHRGLTRVAEWLRKDAGATSLFEHGYMFQRLAVAAARIAAGGGGARKRR